MSVMQSSGHMRRVGPIHIIVRIVLAVLNQRYRTPTRTFSLNSVRGCELGNCVRVDDRANRGISNRLGRSWRWLGGCGSSSWRKLRVPFQRAVAIVAVLFGLSTINGHHRIRHRVVDVAFGLGSCRLGISTLHNASWKEMRVKKNLLSPEWELFVPVKRGSEP